MTNKRQIATWVQDYGEDSDFVRVRIKGEFPRAGTMQFIDSERVQQAVERELFKNPTAALIMGVDIARQGIELLGLEGLTDAHPGLPLMGRLGALYRASVGSTISGGSAEILQVVIARRGLGLR